MIDARDDEVTAVGAPARRELPGILPAFAVYALLGEAAVLASSAKGTAASCIDGHEGLAR